MEFRAITPTFFHRMVFAGLVLLSFPANASTECATLQDIEEIKAYIECSTNTDLNACSGLFAATTVAGATKVAYKQNQSMLVQENIEKSLKERIEKVYLFNRYEKAKADLPQGKVRKPELMSGGWYTRKVVETDRTIKFLALEEKRLNLILNGTDEELEQKLNDLKRKSVTILSPARDDLGGTFGLQIRDMKAAIEERKSLTPAKRQELMKKHDLVKDQMEAFSRFLQRVQASEHFISGNFVWPHKLKFVDGEWVDLNNMKLLGYSAFDEKFKKEAAQFADDFLKKSEAARVVYASSENALALNSLKPQDFKDEMRILDKIEVNPKRMRKQIIAEMKIDNPSLFKKMLANKNSEFSFQKLVQQARARVPTKAAAVKVIEKFERVPANPLVGAVVVMVSSIDVTACSTSDMPYVNRDPQNNCRANYSLNENVAKFLDLPPAEQKKLLADPGICGYYKEMHAELLSVPQIKTIKCDDQGSTAKIETVDRYNKKSTIIFDQFASGQNIKIYEYEFHTSGAGELASYAHFPNSYGGSSTKKFQRSQEDFAKSTESEEDQKAQSFFRRAKLYIPQIADCCTQKSLSAQCKEQLNFQERAGSITQDADSSKVKADR